MSVSSGGQGHIKELIFINIYPSIGIKTREIIICQVSFRQALELPSQRPVLWDSVVPRYFGF